jgi:hypothetical protein
LQRKKKKELATNSRIICSSHFKIFASQMSEQKRGEKSKRKKEQANRNSSQIRETAMLCE